MAWVEPSGSTAEEFARIIAAESDRWAAVARAANIMAGKLIREHKIRAD